MTKSRLLGLAVLGLGWALGTGWAQASAQAQPADLAWAAAEFEGGGEWAGRLPQLLTKGWDRLPAHVLTEAERRLLKDRFLGQARAGYEAQIAKARLDLDRKALVSALPATEPAATEKSIAALEAKVRQTQDGTLAGAEAPLSLAFRAVAAPGREGLPWPSQDAASLAAKAQAVYTVTGSFRSVAGRLVVKADLTSAWEGRVLATWEGSFDPSEAPDQMALAADTFREILLGRPWAAVTLTSAVPGTRVKVDGTWHSLPWVGEDLAPGSYTWAVEAPGRPAAAIEVTAAPGTRTSRTLEGEGPAADTLVLETDPPGALLYADSRYLGPSPQTLARPLTTTRIRAQAPGLATLAWEVGPDTPSPSLGHLKAPVPLRPVLDTKDKFYETVVWFSAGITVSSFLGAWANETALLGAQYSAAGSASGYRKASLQYTVATAAYGTSAALTTGVFVWMMARLGDYLGANEDTLP